MFILLVLEDPFGADNIAAMIGSLHESLHIIPLEVVEFLLHCYQPIGIFKCIVDLEWFHHGDKGMVLAKVASCLRVVTLLFRSPITLRKE